MKKFIFFFLILKINVYCQSNLINYQAVIRDLNNLPVANKNISVRISISSDSSFDNSSYIEIHKTITNVNGLFNILIGSGIEILNNFDSIKWNSLKHFVKSEIDINGGGNFKHFSTSELRSVPYALHSKSSDYCKTAENVINLNKNKRYIGEIFEGGVIFHIEYDSTGKEHGLIVSIANILPSKGWSNIFNNISNNINYRSFDGFQNTLDIVQQFGHDSSGAMQCLEYIYNGFDDWYLPSIDEIILLSNQRYIINKSLFKITGSMLLRGTYSIWSSTEAGANSAFYFNLASNTIGIDTKNRQHSIRPIRKF
jgi:hypothetical protein